MLLMVEKNEYKVEYFMQYIDMNNLYGWTMLQKLPVDGFKWRNDDKQSNFDEKFIKRYYKDSEKRCILEVDVKYPKNLHDLPFFHEE